MKTYLTYGAAMAGGAFALVMLIYIFGFHSDASKLGVAQVIQTVGGLGISITAIVLGTQARRATVPANEDFSYGSALFAGFMIALFSSLIGIVTTLLYTQLINPGLNEVVIQAQTAKWESMGLSSAQIEKAEGITRKMTSPAVQASMGFFFGLLFGTIVSLITAAFLKREATEVVAEPPVGA